MGLWATLKTALGLDPDPVLRTLPPVALSPAAEARLVALPDGHGATIRLMPVPAGVVVQVDEGPVDAPAHPAFDGLPVAATDAVVDRLRGLTLDVVDDRWRVLATVKLRARETPNPDGRLYLTDRVLGEGRPTYVDRVAEAAWLPAQLLARDDVRAVLVRDHTLTVVRQPDQPWDPIDAAVTAAVRAHVLSAGAPVRPRERAAHDGLETAIWEVLAQQVLPGIHRDGGDLELVGVDDGVVRVHLVGACTTCPASTLTLKGAVERVLVEAFPGEVERVEQV